MDSNLSIELERPDVYDFWGTLRFQRFGPYDPTTSLSKTELVQARWYADGPATLRLTDVGDHILVDAVGPGANTAVASARHLLGLDDRPPTLTGHPVVERLSKHYRGTRLSRCASFADPLVQIILQQRIEWQDAANIWRDMTRHLGEVAPCGQLRLPPHRDIIRRTTLPEFRRLNLAAQQARTLHEVCRIAPRIDRWANESSEQIRYRLRHVRGVGPWSTEMTLALYWGDADAVPTGDYALPHSVAFALRGVHRSTDEEMLAMLEPFRGHRGRVIRWIMGANITPPRRGPRARRQPR